MKETLKNKLKPLYEKLYQKFGNESFDSELSAFYVHVGSEWKQRKGILFVGKATNGWESEKDQDKLFAHFVEDKEPIKWVEDQIGSKDKYNTSKSAFWRVIRKITYLYFSENWYKNIAWSNLCKVAPTNGGNPCNEDFYKQRDICKEILLTEIDILKPKAIILFTSDWNILDLPKESKIAEEKWENTSSILYKVNGVYYIHSVHPQGKKELPHKEAIEKLISMIEDF